MTKSRRRPSRARKRTKRARSVAAARKRMRLLATSLAEHSDRTANSLLIMKEETRDPCVLESSRSIPSDSNLKEMRLSSEFNGHLVKVKLELPDVPCLPEEAQTRQQNCNESSSGGDADGTIGGMCHIKEEPREDPSNEDAIIEVKTEPYNVPALAKEEEMGHSCDSTSTLEEFFQSTDLQRHESAPTGEKLYKCDVCPAEFSLSGHLQVHKRTHMGKKPYKCDICPAEFCRIWNLRDHKRRHADEKPHKCQLCPAEFCRLWSLRLHKRTHTGEKPYKCDVCPARFIQKTGLQCHKRTHTGEKPYKCDVCPAEFSHTRYLKRHKLGHMGE